MWHLPSLFPKSKTLHYAYSRGSSSPRVDAGYRQGDYSIMILDHPAISCESVRDRRPRASAAPWRQTPRVSSLFWMETNPGLACLGPRVQHLGRFQRGTSLQQDSTNPGAPRGQEWNSRTGNWLRTDLPRQLPASVRLAPLLTHVRAAGTQNLCEEFKIPSELASLSSENAKCHFKKKAGWRWRACLCPPHTPLQTNH